METMKFKVPEGTESIEQSLVDGCLVTKFIPKVEELKDLDCYMIKHSPNNVFCIFKDMNHAYVVKDSLNGIDSLVQGEWQFDKRWTKITRKEMQSVLAKHGKYFDFGMKVLKDLRWRAKHCEEYFWLDFNNEGTIHVGVDEVFDPIDEHRYLIGNYHQTKEECEEYAQKMIEYSKSLID